MGTQVFEALTTRETSLAVIGLGYVGLPIAAAFADKGLRVIGFDINHAKIERYRGGEDVTGEVGHDILRKTAITFTADETMLEQARFYVVAVPTPINQDHTPDLSPVENACRIVGRHLTQNSIVVFESTVYPGVTEDICIPLLERESGYRCGVDFKVGYSPERINPGDRVHRLENICKIVSGMDEDSLAQIRQVYDLIIEAGTHPVSCVKTAEAIKVVENSQRDINIAFMNELAMVFDRMGIDTGEVVDGMNTKWNALGFRPGLVGGHCIGVDPYFFTYKAEKLGYHSQIVLNGRIVNDSMGRYVADTAIKRLLKTATPLRDCRVVILGLTFKENCADIRNSKVADIVKRLQEYEIVPQIADPLADREEVERMYGLSLIAMQDIADADCVILAVAHEAFCAMPLERIKAMYKPWLPDHEKILLDVKGIYGLKELQDSGLCYWRL